MNKLDLIIRNGQVVLPEGIEKLDIGIKNGKIVLLKSTITETAQEEHQADGVYIFPGMIDTHVHFNEPGREDWEGFSTGSTMMAAGGCTTFFDMPLNGIPSTIDTKSLLEKAKVGKMKSVIDFGLWGGLVPGNKQELASLAEAGVIGFKAFLSASGNDEFEAADDRTLLEGMEEIARLGKVLALHAESRTITDFLSEQKKQANQISAKDYAESRPIAAEVEAVQRSLHYAAITGCSLHFVHISSKQAVDLIHQAKDNGVDVTVETCAHYLLYTHDALEEKGAVAKCAPPLRTEAEQQKLIQTLLNGKLDFITSDHSPSPFSLKDPAKYDLMHAWGGISGGQFTLLATLELAVEHKIPLEKVAAWTANNPANRFGLSSKGKIKQGLDADFALVDFRQTFRVTKENYYAKHKQSLYMDHTFPCRIIHTYSKGQLVYTDGSTESYSPHGDWLRSKAGHLTT